MAVKIFAAIDVGSYELAMKIFQFSAKGGMQEIDHIRHRIELGTDTYNTGKISRERVEELCSILGEFREIMDSYHVDAYRAYGTSAIRETVNAPIVLGQIKLRTGLTVEMLSNSEQRFMHYKAVASRGEQFSTLIEEGAAVVDIGGGSIQLSLFDKDTLVTTQNIRLGILRMREQLMDLKPKTTHYEKLLEELVDNQLHVFKRLYLKDKKIANIIIVDDYISYVMQRLGKGGDIVTAGQFADFVDLMRRKNPEEVASDFGIAQESASLLLPSAILVRRILKATHAEKIWAPGVSLADGIAYEYGESGKYIKNRHDFENDIVACAINMGKRYQADKERNRLLETVALQLFDYTKKIHGMGKRERLLLRIAALLNDCGRYISLEAAAECGYSIIMATEMIGLSHAEREIVANLVRFNKAPFDYRGAQCGRSYLEIAKLCAIFRVADGICRSYRTKVQDVKFSQKDETLVISVDADEEITLEKGFFGRKAGMFEEVFGITPVLRQKKNLHAF
ncbi:MAG: exopolyphosphatase [Lachnospiraceae bacterium]|nr:exopolyphosphatase [Lachnospiraceae bacterium]